jgi:small subunit ribosomal protein S16
MSIHEASGRVNLDSFETSPKTAKKEGFTTRQDTIRLGNSFLDAAVRRAVEIVARRRHAIKIMAVRIRMKRVGAKNAPYYRIVVADSRSPRDGKFIEEIGAYQPLKKGDNVKLDLERVNYWVSKGAQPSETVASFIKKLAKAALAA